VPNVRLAISIGSAIRTKRLRLMPVERSQPLREVLDLAAAEGAT
jgi:adenine C2-methylase RlmN of 23S rRNA A2503 and tRNA A37